MQSPVHIPIILASTSPRRVELMSAIGLSCERAVPLSKEFQKPGEFPKAMVKRLAKEKAESVIASILRKHAAAVIISADTVVLGVKGKKILGKPKNRKEATQMLMSLVGKTHTVYTGYCIFWVERRRRPKVHVRVVSSRVKMRKLSRLGVENYIRLDHPMDKAGSYAAQGLGMALIESIHGSYTNIVGLPIAQVLMDLEKHFGISLWDQ